ncbi:MAG: cyclic nucleotide-binding domain-containing protein [Actinobacteria bacterium]|nr:cyclic nucleotide-binding domain-containing protein [Actinomycetota bacterium]
MSTNAATTPTTPLADLDLFADLSRSELRAVQRLMTPVRVRAGRNLTNEGEAGREFMVIVDGTATVRRRGRVVATLGAGDFIGELSMLAGVPRTATVTADTDLAVEALNRREFATLLDENPRLARKVMISAIRRLHSVDHGPAD